MDQIALRIKLQDEQAFELLFRRYYHRLCAFANKFLNNPEEAQEVVQEVFTRIWESRDDIDPQESLTSYIFKITRNLSVSRLRRRRVESAYNDVLKLVYIEHSEFTSLDLLIGKELEANIATAIGKLPGQCRKIFELSRIEGLKYNEIAKTLNISVKTVETQMSRALKSLRSDLTEHLVIVILILIITNL